jgi:hypothetical protein
MSDRYIEVPKNVTIVSGGKPIEQPVFDDEGKPITDESGKRVKTTTMQYSFKEFIQHILNDQEHFGGSGAKLRMAVRIEAAAENIEEGGLLVLKEEDWKQLHLAAEEPKMGYPVLVFGNGGQIPIGRQLLAFVDVLCDPPNVNLRESKEAV